MPDFRAIPAIEMLRQRQAVRDLERGYGRDAVVAELREAADGLRRRLGIGDPEAVSACADRESAARLIEREAAAGLAARVRPSLRPVINATGVIVHTNLGRAPLAPVAARRASEIGVGYANLEFDLDQGRRGARDTHAEAILCRLLGVEAAVVVNNNAAATLLVLAALAAGREVVVSRGELVEIGGGFRVPDVMAQSGAILREVGTTNRTRVADYESAIGDRTALVLRVHRSNFRIEGFTEQPALEALAALGRQRGVPVFEDLGGGFLGAPGDDQADSRLRALLGGEPTVQASIAAGIDVVSFSGDKLLGGPQAGLIVGRREVVGRVRRHPLMRALRVDKVTYAALEATLGEYAAGRAARTVPVLQMILAPIDDLEARGRHLLEVLAAAVAGGPGADTGARLQAEIVDGRSAVGGGTTPGLELPSRLLAVSATGRSADALDSRLRQGDPPIVGRIEQDRLVLDLRTILPEQDETVVQALAKILV